MGNEKGQFKFIKPDLKIAIEQIKIEPGNFVIVRPRDKQTTFTADFCAWLAEKLPDLLPPGTRAMILNDHSTEFQVLKPEVGDDCPPEEANAYKSGWYNALGALEEACS
jgi:hypothetical protein